MEVTKPDVDRNKDNGRRIAGVVAPELDGFAEQERPEQQEY